jgi:hypothetical protein
MAPWILLLPYLAAAAVPVALPPTESPRDWAPILALGGMELARAGTVPTVRLEVTPKGWRIVVHDDAGGVLALDVAAPRSNDEREDVVWLAKSLLHPARSGLAQAPATDASTQVEAGAVSALTNGAPTEPASTVLPVRDRAEPAEEPPSAGSAPQGPSTETKPRDRRPSAPSPAAAPPSSPAAGRTPEPLASPSTPGTPPASPSTPGASATLQAAFARVGSRPGTLTGFVIMAEPEAVSARVTLSPEPVGALVTLAPEPVAARVTLSPEPVGALVTLAPEPVAARVTLTPEPMPRAGDSDEGTARGHAAFTLEPFLSVGAAALLQSSGAAGPSFCIRAGTARSRTDVSVALAYAPSRSLDPDTDHTVQSWDFAGSVDRLVAGFRPGVEAGVSRRTFLDGAGVVQVGVVPRLTARLERPFRIGSSFSLDPSARVSLDLRDTEVWVGNAFAEDLPRSVFDLGIIFSWRKMTPE